MTGARGHIEHVTEARGARMRGLCHHDDPRCPPFSALRVLTLPYVDFGGERREGELVVAKEVAEEVVAIFEALCLADFPIRCMEPIEAYGGDDDLSMAADNTSAFNCRKATGSGRWSQHAYGLAVDVNPIENPYVENGRVFHDASVRYVDRSRRLRGMIHAGDAVVRAFRSIGWGWGGSWGGSVRDYQHFSSTGS